MFLPWKASSSWKMLSKKQNVPPWHERYSKCQTKALTESPKYELKDWCFLVLRFTGRVVTVHICYHYDLESWVFHTHRFGISRNYVAEFCLVSSIHVLLQSRGLRDKLGLHTEDCEHGKHCWQTFSALRCFSMNLWSPSLIGEVYGMIGSPSGQWEWKLVTRV